MLEIAQQRAATYNQDVGAPMDLPDTDGTIARVNAQVNLAVAAAVDFSTDMASVSEALLAQHERIVTAGKVLHAELDDIVGQLAQEVKPEYDERPLGPLALPQLKDLPPGVHYVCNAGPSQTLPCFLCMEGGECDPSEWDFTAC